MEKRVLIATFLSMMIIFVFWQAFQKPPVAGNQPGAAQVTKTAQVAIPEATAMAVPAKTTPIEAPIQAEKLVTVNTSTSKISIGTKGGGIAAWQIKDKNGQWVNMTPSSSEKRHMLILDTKQAPYLSAVVFNTDQRELFLHDSEQGTVTLTGQTPEGLEIVRKYLFTGEGYLVKADINFKNAGKAPIKVPEFNLLWGPGLNPLHNKAEQNTANAWLNGKIARKIKPEFQAGETRWAALDSQYFIVALVPGALPFSGAISERDSEKKISAGLAQK